MSSGGPALLEFLTKGENALSRYPARAPRALPCPESQVGTERSPLRQGAPWLTVVLYDDE